MNDDTGQDDLRKPPHAGHDPPAARVFQKTAGLKTGWAPRPSQRKID